MIGIGGNLAKNVRKLRFIKREEKTKGEIPGALTFVGDIKQDFVKISVIAYDEDQYLEEELDSLDGIENYISQYKNVWINIDGLHDLSVVRSLGNKFGIHSLIMEDVVNTEQRPKVYPIDEMIFIVMRMIRLEKESSILHSEQLSMILKANYLITFQEQCGDVFDAVRERIRSRKGRIRSFKVDYLAYCLLDSVADNYLYVMGHLGAKVEELEDRILLKPEADVLQDINRYKIELNYFRKAIGPAREAVIRLTKLKTPLFEKETLPFIDDLLDLVSRAFEAVENYKSMLSEQLTVYNINVTNRLNEIMRVLTIFSAVFIPLTFIAGIYGMNFDSQASSLNMPELHTQYGYVIVLSVMFVVAFSLILFFRFKKWL